ncbi:hypothetical protein B0H19DRAFT_1079681 [Mycena capillaripes]|nr:hypothetical protein B0H19DRAFT_1079681 [Mycena capillaripes]
MSPADREIRWAGKDSRGVILVGLGLATKGERRRCDTSRSGVAITRRRARHTRQKRTATENAARSRAAETAHISTSTTTSRRRSVEHPVQLPPSVLARASGTPAGQCTQKRSISTQSLAPNAHSPLSAGARAYAYARTQTRLHIRRLPLCARRVPTIPLPTPATPTPNPSAREEKPRKKRKNPNTVSAEVEFTPQAEETLELEACTPARKMKVTRRRVEGVWEVLKKGERRSLRDAQRRRAAPEERKPASRTRRRGADELISTRNRKPQAEHAAQKDPPHVWLKKPKQTYNAPAHGLTEEGQRKPSPDASSSIWPRIYLKPPHPASDDLSGTAQ